MTDETGKHNLDNMESEYRLVRHDRRDGQPTQGTTDGTDTRRTQLDRRDGKCTISTTWKGDTVWSDTRDTTGS